MPKLHFERLKDVVLPLLGAAAGASAGNLFWADSPGWSVLFGWF